MRWVVYYADGSRLTDTDRDVWSLPERGVLCIAQEDYEVGRIVISQHDYYWWVDTDPHGWFGGDIFGLWDYLARPGHKRVLFGRTVSNERFRDALALATHDEHLPDKSARSGYRERRGD